jgi:hypothetical protein
MTMKHVILHGHIFKNAGTTLDWALERSFGGAFVDHRRDDLMRAEGQAHIRDILAEEPGLRAISSHHMPGDVSDDPGYHFHRIYLLRHPILRIRSVYDFERKQDAQTPGAQAAKRMTFSEYVEWRMRPKVAPTIRNFQSRYLAGRLPPRYDKRADLEYFELAMQTLEHVPCIGIVEHYDESMVLFEQLLGERFPDLDLAHTPQNVSSNGLSKLDEDERVSRLMGQLGKLQARVLEANSFDLALYEAARYRFSQRLEAIEDFSDRLQKFRKRCSKLSRKKGLAFFAR